MLHPHCHPSMGMNQDSALPGHHPDKLHVLKEDREHGGQNILMDKDSMVLPEPGANRVTFPFPAFTAISQCSELHCLLNISPVRFSAALLSALMHRLSHYPALDLDSSCRVLIPKRFFFFKPAVVIAASHKAGARSHRREYKGFSFSRFCLRYYISIGGLCL